MRMMSPIYWSASFYNVALKLLYGTQFKERFRCVAARIPSDTKEILDVCCGTGLLFDLYLRQSDVHYIGLDFNKSLLRRVRKIGGETIHMQLPGRLPAADVVLMMGSLYHFKGQEAEMVDFMIAAARKKVIILEPVQAMSSSLIGGFLGKWATYIHNTSSSYRIREHCLKEIMKRYPLAAFTKVMGEKYMMVEIQTN